MRLNSWTLRSGSEQATLWQICYRGVRGFWQPFGKFVIGFRGYRQPCGKFPRGYWQLLQIAHICQRVARGLDNLHKHLQEVCPISKEKRQPFCNTSEETKS